MAHSKCYLLVLWLIKLENKKAVGVQGFTLLCGVRHTCGRSETRADNQLAFCSHLPVERVLLADSRFSSGDRQPNGKLQWNDPILSLNSDRHERLENVIKFFVPVFPDLGWSCLLLWDKASGIRGIAVILCVEILVYSKENFRYSLTKYSKGTHISVTSSWTNVTPWWVSCLCWFLHSLPRISSEHFCGHANVMINPFMCPHFSGPFFPVSYARERCVFVLCSGLNLIQSSILLLLSISL